MILITNNPSANKKYSGSIETAYLEGEDFSGVLNAVRDRIHLGHKLLTHPLSGSIKPGQTPYKSILVSKVREELDTGSLAIIEGSIAIMHSQKKVVENARITDGLAEDFQLIDISLIESGIKI